MQSIKSFLSIKRNYLIVYSIYYFLLGNLIYLILSADFSTYSIGSGVIENYLSWKIGFNLIIFGGLGYYMSNKKWKKRESKATKAQTP